MQFIKQTHADIQKIREFDINHAPVAPDYYVNSINELEAYFNEATFVCYGVFDDALIGRVCYQKKTEDNYYLNALVVHKDYRKQGVGSNILQKVIEEIQKNGGKKLFLTVSPHNTSAFNFYKNHGFTIYKSQNNVYGPGFDRVYMSLDL